jgi:hypothetical protein
MTFPVALIEFFARVRDRDRKCPFSPPVCEQEMRAISRFVFCLLQGVVTWCAAVLAQPVDRTNDVDLDELRGTTIHSSITWAGEVRLSGHDKVYRAENRWRWKIDIDEKGMGSTFLTREVRGGGRVATHKYSGSGYIDQVSTRSNRDGAGASVWSYNNSTLTLLKVFERGGRIVEIKLTRTSGGLACALSGAYLKEGGTSTVKTRNPFGPGYIETLSMKQTSSTCRIVKAASRT